MTSIDHEILGSEEWNKPWDLMERCSEFGINKGGFISRLVLLSSDISSKSSVLQSLTGITFTTPRAISVYFNTEILLRRTDDEGHVNVSIIPNPGPVSEKFKSELSAFKFSMAEKELGADGLSDIHSRAVDFLKRSVTDSQQYPHRIWGWLVVGNLYSPHVLRIELFGRNRPNLSIFDFNLDLDENLRSSIFPEGLDIKSTLSYRYLANQSAILLMVVEGQKDSEIEHASRTALEVDPQQTRTIGAIKGRVGLGLGAQRLLANRDILLQG
ncbi:hypothetical protein TWF506_010767 [Arthrobotrys conoides]|uniref:Uncharacterized protein n=1 Tax=Arthrobotrys conoides TaxID=74498 RepID=A0AAN8N6X6_9PEZI